MFIGYTKRLKIREIGEKEHGKPKYK